MYDVSVNYTGNAQCPPLKTSTGEVIQPGHTWAPAQFQPVLEITVPARGTIGVLDISEQFRGDPNHGTWGIMVTYQGRAATARYEGQPKLDITVNSFGEVTLGGVAFTLVAWSPLSLAKSWGRGTPRWRRDAGARPSASPRRPPDGRHSVLARARAMPHDGLGNGNERPWPSREPTATSRPTTSESPSTPPWRSSARFW